MLKTGIITAADHLGLHRGEVDALNVFPVPDGDTGTNMSMTVQAAAREIALIGDDSGFDLAAKKTYDAMLRGARGNSGVILSLIFRGIANSVRGKPQIGGADIAKALQSGTDEAYRAVAKPTEGTILTVARIASLKAAEAARESARSAVEVFTAALEGARHALAQTPSMLPILKTAGVVDAGGQGLVYIMEGLLQGFSGGADRTKWQDEPIIISEEAPQRLDEDIQFAYCTEFLVDRTADAGSKDVDALRDYLHSVGDCVVVVDDEEILKVHVHNNVPGEVLTFAQQYGPFIQIKIENMRRQHQETAWAKEAAAQEEGPVPAQKRFGIVAVASGDGVVEMLKELGVDQIVSGGQSMNPSTEDILKAIHQTPAEHVFVLPNNKNIIMAAEQAVPLTERGVSVLPTKTVAQGIAAVLDFDESSDIENNHVHMMRAAEKVRTGLVTFAARDSRTDGMEIKKGSVIGLENEKLTVTEEEPVQAAWRVARHLVRKFDGKMITIYSGQDVSEEQTQTLVERLERRYNGAVDITAVYGGQPLYYFMIAVE
jgi:DAK2 domain fusion protein YloV